MRSSSSRSCDSNLSWTHVLGEVKRLEDILQFDDIHLIQVSGESCQHLGGGLGQVREPPSTNYIPTGETLALYLAISLAQIYCLAIFFSSTIATLAFRRSFLHRRQRNISNFLLPSPPPTPPICAPSSGSPWSTLTPPSKTRSNTSTTGLSLSTISATPSSSPSLSLRCASATEEAPQSSAVSDPASSPGAGGRGVSDVLPSTQPTSFSPLYPHRFRVNVVGGFCSSCRSPRTPRMASSTSP